MVYQTTKHNKEAFFTQEFWPSAEIRLKSRLPIIQIQSKHFAHESLQWKIIKMKNLVWRNFHGITYMFDPIPATIRGDYSIGL